MKIGMKTLKKKEERREPQWPDAVGGFFVIHVIIMENKQPIIIMEIEHRVLQHLIFFFLTSRSLL